MCSFLQRQHRSAFLVRMRCVCPGRAPGQDGICKFRRQAAARRPPPTGEVRHHQRLVSQLHCRSSSLQVSMASRTWTIWGLGLEFAVEAGMLRWNIVVLLMCAQVLSMSVFIVLL